MKRILLIAEAATLAHVARPVIVARALAEQGCDVILARPQAYSWVTDGEPCQCEDLICQSPKEFARRLDTGKPLYGLETLQAYVNQDLDLLQRIQPDVVIGDFRLSLSVSARLHGLPYVTLCDAYWSPETPLAPALPVLPFTRFTPIRVAEALFRLTAPLAFRIHAQPMETLRKQHGLPGFGHDLRQCYTDADLRLFANPQPLFPEVRTHPGARFIGPIAWSPAGALPDTFPCNGGHIYVSMGSSGNTQALSAIIEALAEDPREAILTTAGRPIPSIPKGSRIRVFDFLPGASAIAGASLVICNGGSPTTNQALRAGVPVLGIPTNMDQFLNMRALENHGVGLSIRADRVSTSKVTHHLVQLRDESPHHLLAHKLAIELEQNPMDGKSLGQLITDVTSRV